MAGDAVIQWIKEALSLHMQGRPAGAEPLYLKALAADENLYPALYGMNLIRLHQGRHAEALSYVDRALALDPGNEDAWSNRGLSLVALGRAEEATGIYDWILQRRPGALEVRYQRARALNAIGRTADALTDLDYVLQAKPDHVDACVVRANLLWMMGATDQALESFGRALALEPTKPEALWGRSNCRWTRKQDVAGAIADLERLVALNPDFPYARGALLHMRMHAGDWRDFARQRATLDEGVRAGQRVVEPFAYQALRHPARATASARSAWVICAVNSVRRPPCIWPRASSSTMTARVSR
jgi:tetratricopeptide (TPR) repeat protein